MFKNRLVASLFLVAAISVLGVHSGFADDATDSMEALLKAQEESEKLNSPEVAKAPVAVVATSTQEVASTADTATQPAQDETPGAVSSEGEPVKARDVLTAEEKKTAEPSLDDEEKKEGEDAAVSAKASLLEAAATGGTLMIADFDGGDKPNNLGGDYGQWDKDPNDDTQGCRLAHASDDASGNLEGFALRLDYDVDSPSPAYNGFWMKLENLNATPYDTLSLYVRGASHRFTKRVKVELKTPDSRSASFIISGITDQWQKIQVPLKRFKGIKDWSILSEMILVFDDINTAPKKGTILFDQIMLERVEKGMPQQQSQEKGYLLSENNEPEAPINKEL